MIKKLSSSSTRYLVGFASDSASCEQEITIEVGKLELCFSLTELDQVFIIDGQMR